MKKLTILITTILLSAACFAQKADVKKDEILSDGKTIAKIEKEAVVNYGGMKNKGKIKLYSKAQYGLSIFWQTI